METELEKAWRGARSEATSTETPSGRVGGGVLWEGQARKRRERWIDKRIHVASEPKSGMRV